MDEIAAALADADGGQPRIVALEGDAGMGKTSLLARALERCREHPGGATVLRGGGDAAESDLAYGLLDQLVAEVDPTSWTGSPSPGRPATPASTRWRWAPTWSASSGRCRATGPPSS